jgi:hypothetical protein
MKESPNSRPNDDASDPLLAALRQRLGDYGAAPPPSAWAAIRQQLPPPAPMRPWWRRPRRLLPLLILLLGLVTTGILLRSNKLHLGLPANTSVNKTPVIIAHNSVNTARQPRAVVSSAPTAATTTPVPNAKNPSLKHAPQPLVAKSSSSQKPVASPLANQKELRYSAHTVDNELFTKNPVSHSDQQLVKSSTSRFSQQLRLATGVTATHHSRSTSSHTTTASILAQKATTNGILRLALLPTRRRAAATQRRLASGQPASLPTPLAIAQRTKFRTRQQEKRVDFSDPNTLQSTFYIQVDSGFENQSTRVVRLLPTPAVPLPAPLVARPDSTPPTPPIRRWALLALAGPTLSYRTIGAAPTTAAGPDFAHLERPAAGLGAQVQVRRVLTGRWALAAGLGYQEYATRLALQLSDSAGSRHLNQRDTYRLLTLPIQLSYALRAPRGRLAKALLVGTEMGWYQGGRSTEGSDCGCQQQAYSATSNPYRPWSLALSLGLDLRYRVGSPASRWQWVVQPTGRYVLTSLVGANALGFSARRPFSVGLLTGFSWDIR